MEKTQIKEQSFLFPFIFLKFCMVIFASHADDIGSEWKWGICQKDNNPTMKNLQLKAIRRSSMNGEVNPHQRMVYNWPLITNTEIVK